MLPLCSWKLSHGWVCFTLFLLSLTWTPVKLEQSELICVEAPRVPTMTRCTRCSKDQVPKDDVGSVQDPLSPSLSVKDPLPPSTEYCLKGFRRFEVELNETILNMTLINREDHLFVARLIGSEGILSSPKPLYDCRKSEIPKTNPLNDEDYKQCLPSEAAESNEICATQLTNALKKLTALLSSEVGKRSLPSCDDFEDYPGKNHTGDEVATVRNNSEAATPKLWVLRDRQISNISFYSSDWVLDGKRISLSKNVIGHGNLPNWFSKEDCPNDPIVGGVNFSTSNYPHLHLVADVVVVKGWSSTVPGLYHEDMQLNLSRTSVNEGLHRFGDISKKLVAAFTSAECRVVEISKNGPQSYTAENKTVDYEGNQLVDIDLLREDILMKVEPEINEIDVGGVEGETEVEEDVQQSCEVTSEEFIRLGSLYGVKPNTFVRTVLRHQTISPVYSSFSNRTLLEASPNFTIDVVEQFAISTALPAYDYRLMQVNQRSGEREWERVVEYGASSYVAVSAEMGASLLDDYKKTFSLYGAQGPLLVHIHFSDRHDFAVRVEKPLLTWELQLQLRVLKWFPLNATFRADELNQFMSFRKPTHPIVNCTVLEAEDLDKFAVKWHLTADSDQLAQLLQTGKDLIIAFFGKSDGAVEGDGLLDLLANIVTGSTKEEQRRGEEMISEELASMVKLAWKKLIALSPTAPQDPTTVEEMLLAGWRALWDILIFVGLVAESENVTPSDGEFVVDFDHFINLLFWLVEPVEC